MAICPSTEGVTIEMPALPSLAMAVPWMTAWTASPSATACASGLRITTPTPSLRTKPSASLPANRHRPVGESMLACDSVTLSSGCRITFTPAASAMDDSPLRRLWQARCSATSEAVSTDRLGPRRSNAKDSRPDCALRMVPRLA